MTEEKPKLLLHVCCGPCATAVLEKLVERFHVTAFWHNPNIQPSEEHDRRLEQARIVAREFEVELVVDEGASPPGPLSFADDAMERGSTAAATTAPAGRMPAVQEWLSAVAGLEEEPEGGARCEVCHRLRLQRTTEEAARRGIPNVATTLTVSPHKPPDLINKVGREVAEALGVCFLEEDFKQGGGFERSAEMSKEMGLYRQRYCGCLLAKGLGG